MNRRENRNRTGPSPTKHEQNVDDQSRNVQEKKNLYANPTPAPASIWDLIKDKFMQEPKTNSSASTSNVEASRKTTLEQAARPVTDERRTNNEGSDSKNMPQNYKWEKRNVNRRENPGNSSGSSVSGGRQSGRQQVEPKLAPGPSNIWDLMKQKFTHERAPSRTFIPPSVWDARKEKLEKERQAAELTSAQADAPMPPVKDMSTEVVNMWNFEGDEADSEFPPLQDSRTSRESGA
ncbi:hypothetical protein WMY93_022725 [Mugilogobius chulae]|uniref:Uncharacterized protein n=1 Tax=Mugilogobius chulae TaxID=88201 RepID=A0AAW0N9B9_9GOBI